MPDNKENTSAGTPDETPRKFEISGGQDISDSLLRKDTTINDTVVLQDLSTDKQTETFKWNEETNT